MTRKENVFLSKNTGPTSTMQLNAQNAEMTITSTTLRGQQKKCRHLWGVTITLRKNSRVKNIPHEISMIQIDVGTDVCVYISVLSFDDVAFSVLPIG